jgi:hypothetical protein
VIAFPTVLRPAARFGVRMQSRYSSVEKTLDEVVVLPKGAFGSVVACIGAQLADDGALGGGFECQGHDNALDIVPFADDELLLGLSHGPDDCITVLACVFEADQGSADFIVQILVAGARTSRSQSP